MKFFTLILLFCACIITARVLEILKLQVLKPPLSRSHIPAPPFTLNEIIAVTARKHGVDPAVVKSIIRAESAFSATAVSPKGAVGLMQLMPETARQFGADATVPEQNIEAGTHYLSSLLQRYARKRDTLRRAIAAYNAGPGAVERYRGIPPFRETRTYVARVLRFYQKYQVEVRPVFLKRASLRLRRDRSKVSLD